MAVDKRDRLQIAETAPIRRSIIQTAKGCGSRSQPTGKPQLHKIGRLKENPSFPSVFATH